MSIQTFDRTLVDLGRRNLNLRQYETEAVLSGWIVEQYPKLVALLSEYYHFEEEDISPSRLIDELFVTRDISQTDIQLLSYIEDELLLGESYFEGFLDKRAAAKYSSSLYRSKGTKYSIQQFFRTFFGIDPDILYTKDDRFVLNAPQEEVTTVNFLTDPFATTSGGQYTTPIVAADGTLYLDITDYDSSLSFIINGYINNWKATYSNGTVQNDLDVTLYQNNRVAIISGLTPNIKIDIITAMKKQLIDVPCSIGAESQKFITDDKLYQTFAILIKSELPISTWRSVYKLFAHPAGMYLGAEIQIVGFVDMDIETQPDPGLLDLPPRELEGIAYFDPDAFEQNTALFDVSLDEEPEMIFRTNLGSTVTYPNPGGNDLDDVADLTIEELDLNYSSVGEYLTPDSPTLDDDDGTYAGDTINGMKINSEETIDQDRFTWVEGYEDNQNDSDGEYTLRELL